MYFNVELFHSDDCAWLPSSCAAAATSCSPVAAACATSAAATASVVSVCAACSASSASLVAACSRSASAKAQHLLPAQRLVSCVMRTRDTSAPNMVLNGTPFAVSAKGVPHAAPILAGSLSEGLRPQASCFWVAHRTCFLARSSSRQAGQDIPVGTHALQPECRTVVFQPLSNVIVAVVVEVFFYTPVDSFERLAAGHTADAQPVRIPNEWRYVVHHVATVVPRYPLKQRRCSTLWLLRSTVATPCRTRSSACCRSRRSSACST